MHNLIRPSLYNAYHHVHNLSRLSDTNTEEVTIVGPICESADVLTTVQQLPTTTAEDDILVIENCGAYGRVMSSRYNRRPFAEELFI